MKLSEAMDAKVATFKWGGPHPENGLRELITDALDEYRRELHERLKATDRMVGVHEAASMVRLDIGRERKP